jgi:hypothetical protein
MFGSPDIQMDVELTCCKGGEGCRRICGGESCVKLLILNAGSQSGVRNVPALPLSAIALCCIGLQMVSDTPFVIPQYLGLTPSYPAKVVPVQFGKHIDASHTLIAQGGSYMMHLGDVNVGTLISKLLVRLSTRQYVANPRYLFSCWTTTHTRLRFGLQPQNLLLCRIWSLPSKAAGYRWQYCLFVGGWDDCLPETRGGGGGHGRYALGRGHGGFGDTGCHVEWLVHVLLWW